MVIFPVGRYHEPSRRIVLDIGAKLKLAGTNIGDRAAGRIFETSLRTPASVVVKELENCREGA